MLCFYSDTYNGLTAVSFHFSRIGNDDGAYQLLKGLDNDLNIGENIDVFDVISDVEGQLDDEWLAVCHYLLFKSMYLKRKIL